MDFEKDLFNEVNGGNHSDPYELRPECILVDKVFDSCFQRECEPSKVIDLPAKGFTNPNVVYGPGFIVDGTLKITPVGNNTARVSFCFRVPFTVTLTGGAGECTQDTLTLNDYVEFCKETEVYLPEAPSEFSFRIVIETRSETLRAEVVGKQLILAIGVIIITKVVGNVQLMVQSMGYCGTPRECTAIAPVDVCTEFLNREEVPPFFPPQMEDFVDN